MTGISKPAAPRCTVCKSLVREKLPRGSDLPPLILWDGTNIPHDTGSIACLLARQGNIAEENQRTVLDLMGDLIQRLDQVAPLMPADGFTVDPPPAPVKRKGAGPISDYKCVSCGHYRVWMPAGARSGGLAPGCTILTCGCKCENHPTVTDQA